MVLIDGNAVGNWNIMLASLLREFRLDSVVPVGTGTICPSEAYEVPDGFTGSYAAAPVTLTVYYVFPRELWSAKRSRDGYGRVFHFGSICSEGLT